MVAHKCFSVLTGSVFSLSVVLFTDGALIARTDGHPYNFVSFAPLVAGCCGLLVLLPLDTRAVLARGNDADEDVLRNKGLFFLASLLFFSSVMVAVWYGVASPDGTTAVWTQVAPLLTALALVSCGVSLFKLKQSRLDDDDYDF